MTLKTREGQSSWPSMASDDVSTAYNLLAEVPEMLKMGIDSVRLSPQPQHMPEIIAAFDAARRGERVQPDNNAWASEGMVDGYWFGKAGISVQHQAASFKGV